MYWKYNFCSLMEMHRLHRSVQMVIVSGPSWLLVKSSVLKPPVDCSFIAAGVRLNHCAAFIFPFEFFIHFTRALQEGGGFAPQMGRPRVERVRGSRQNSVRTRVCVAPFEIPNSVAIKQATCDCHRASLSIKHKMLGADGAFKRGFVSF